jgi:hypothetical protein
MQQFIKNAKFTPTGQSDIDFPGIVSVTPNVATTTNKTQVANNVYEDASITLLHVWTISVVIQDANLWSHSGAANIYEGVEGVLVGHDEAATTGSADQIHTWDRCKVISIAGPMEAGNGPKECSFDLEVWSPSGTATPYAKTAP